MQKAMLAYYQSEKQNNIDELNQLLSEGWKVVSQGASGPGLILYSHVILEKDE